MLDLGCGTGGLLARLRQRGHRRIVGIEWDEQAILASVRLGLDVIHADLNKGLASFADGQFDIVVLSQTLQAVQDVPRVLHEMPRVGGRGIVSFPNIAYHKRRTELAEQGRAPRVHAEYGFQWHNTPYVRSLSIADFEDFCRQQGFTIHQRVALDTEAERAGVRRSQSQRRRGGDGVAGVSRTELIPFQRQKENAEKGVSRKRGQNFFIGLNGMNNSSDPFFTPNLVTKEILL